MRVKVDPRVRVSRQKGNETKWTECSVAHLVVLGAVHAARHDTTLQA